MSPCASSVRGLPALQKYALLPGCHQLAHLHRAPTILHSVESQCVLFRADKVIFCDSVCVGQPGHSKLHLQIAAHPSSVLASHIACTQSLDISCLVLSAVCKGAGIVIMGSTRTIVGPSRGAACSTLGRHTQDSAGAEGAQQDNNLRGKQGKGPERGVSRQVPRGRASMIVTSNAPLEWSAARRVSKEQQSKKRHTSPRLVEELSGEVALTPLL